MPYAAAAKRARIQNRIVYVSLVAATLLIVGLRKFLIAS
jgi:hypothetical protein